MIRFTSEKNPCMAQHIDTDVLLYTMPKAAKFTSNKIFKFD